MTGSITTPLPHMSYSLTPLGPYNRTGTWVTIVVEIDLSRHPSLNDGLERFQSFAVTANGRTISRL